LGHDGLVLTLKEDFARRNPGDVNKSDEFIAGTRSESLGKLQLSKVCDVDLPHYKARVCAAHRVRLGGSVKRGAIGFGAPLLLIRHLQFNHLLQRFETNQTDSNVIQAFSLRNTLFVLT